MNTCSVVVLLLGALFSSAFSFQTPRIIPTPQSIDHRPGFFQFSSQTRVILGDGITQADRDLVDVLNARLEEHSRRPLPIVEERNVRRLTKGSLYLSTPRSDFTRTALRTRGARFRPSMETEGYILDIREEGIVLAATSEQGRYYGMMTLLGLLHADGRRLQLPNVTIHDWPSRSVRGICLNANEEPEEALEDLTRMISLWGSLKLNTIVIDPPRDSHARAGWSKEIEKLQTVARKHRLELRLASETTRGDEAMGPSVRLGFLPPGPAVTASIAAWALGKCSAPRAFLPVIALDAPSLYSSQWLEYLSAWVAENAWSSEPADLGSFARTSFRFAHHARADWEPAFRNSTLLHNSPVQGSWDELWTRPKAQNPCLHEMARRHAAESVTAAALTVPAAGRSSLGSAVTSRLCFLEFLAARLRAEELLARPTAVETSGAGDGRVDPKHRESVQRVLDCLERLESALLDASRPVPFRGQTGELIGAVSFQMQIWTRVMAALEQGDDRPALLLPMPWMLPSKSVMTDSSETVLFRRRVQCVDSPIRALLVLSAFDSVVASVNGSLLPEGMPFSESSSSAHPSVFVFDVTDYLAGGGNRVDLSVTKSPNGSWLASAVLELQYRDGSSATIRSDSLWQSSARRNSPGWDESGECATWYSVVVTPAPGCPLQIPKP